MGEPGSAPYSSAACTLTEAVLLGSVVLPNLAVLAIVPGKRQLSTGNSTDPGMHHYAAGKERNTTFKIMCTT